MIETTYTGGAASTSLTLRDLFAYQAISGCIGKGEYWGDSQYQSIATKAYKLADAMLEAREHQEAKK